MWVIRYSSEMGLTLSLCILSFFIWHGLTSLEPMADWLKVEAPAFVKSGESLTIRVNLSALPEPTLLTVDLHWTGSDEKSKGYLSTGGKVEVGRNGGWFSFNAPVLAKNGLIRVTPIFYLSPTGSWKTHTRAAYSESIPVNSLREQNKSALFKTLKVQDIVETKSKRSSVKFMPRLLTAFLFFLAAIFYQKTTIHLDICSQHKSINNWRLFLTTFFVLAGIWEFFNVEIVLSEQVRALARAFDMYDSRMYFQKAVVSIVIGMIMISTIGFCFSYHPTKCLLAFLSLYAGISLVNLFSLHAIDSFMAITWHGFTVVQSLKLISAFLMLYEILRLENTLKNNSERNKPFKSGSASAT
jgi:hypothetical protein